jgi:amidase
VGVFAETVLGSEPWLRDPGVVPIPWKKDVKAPSKLKLGLLLDDGVVHSSPPVIRCLQEAASALRAAGHEVIELGSDWADMHRRGTKIIFRIYTQEGGIGIREELEKSGEPLVPRTCTGWSENPLTPMEIWLNHRARKAFRAEYLQAYRDLGLDAIITAPSPHPAPPHGQYITSAISAVYNLLDWASCTVPYGKVDLEKDVASPEWYAQDPYDPIPDFPYDRYDKEMKELCE